MTRTRNIKRRFVATLAATATALGLMTAAALPARAETDGADVAKWIAGLAVLAIIADAVEDDRKKSARPAPVPQPVPDWHDVNRHPVPPQPYHPPHGNAWGHHKPVPPVAHPHWPHRPPVVAPVKPPVRVEPQLPRICRVNVQGIRGETRAYAENCLRAQGFWDPLPQHCATPVQIKGRWDRVYGANCMADLGVYGRQKRRN